MIKRDQLHLVTESDRSQYETKGCTPHMDSYAKDHSLEVFKDCLQQDDRQTVLETLQDSDLVGCGGAGFPVYKKWEMVRKNYDNRYLIINALEGEPDTFKDYYLMKNYPLVFAEGIAITSWFIKAKKTLIVINNKYDDCLDGIQDALDLLESRFALDLNIEIRKGPDPEKYVCGEESALLHYLKSNVPEPQLRPPFPTDRGYKDCPTLIQNAETMSWIPLVLFKQSVFKHGSLLKLVSLSGSVNKPGVYEVLMGTSLRRIIEMGGGLKKGKSLEAISVGGISGGFLPAACVDLPFYKKEIADAGAMIGSGSIKILGSYEELLDAVYKTYQFFKDECCERCTPCRVGTRELFKLIHNMIHGNLTKTDLDWAQDISDTMIQTSTCGLGIGASTPLLSFLRYWKHRIDFIHEKRKELAS